MAENKDGADKSEDATPRRIEEARKEGDVAKSNELVQAAALVGAFGAVAMAGGAMAHNLAGALLPFVAHPESIELHGMAGQAVTWQVMMAAAPALFTVLGSTTLAGIAGNIIQHGVLFTTAKLKPDLSKLSIPAGFKRIFGIDGLMNFLRSALKVLLVSAVAWWVLAPHVGELPQLIAMSPVSLIGYSSKVANNLMFAVIALLAVGSVLDFIWQRQRFMERMKMDKEEVKEDYKQSEGDPHVKARRRQIRMDRARRRM